MSCGLDLELHLGGYRVVSSVIFVFFDSLKEKEVLVDLFSSLHSCDNRPRSLLSFATSLDHAQYRVPRAVPTDKRIRKRRATTQSTV